MNADFKKDTFIEVATGEVKATKAPAHLKCLALGSCVAVILSDEEHKIGGIAHVMLPSSVDSKARNADVLKHANHAIYELVRQMLKLGADKGALIARLVGGAFIVPNAMDIGKKNIEAVRNILQELGIRIVDENIGGNVSRSILFDVATSEVQINGKIILIATTKPSLIEKKDREVKSSEYIVGLEEKIAKRTKELSERVEELDNVRKATFNILEDLEKERDGLIEAKAKDEALLASIGDGVIATDAEGKIILINQSAQEMLGWHPEEIIGRLLYDVIMIEDDDGNVILREKRPINMALAGTTTTTTTTTTGPTYNYVRKDKTKFPVAIKVTPVIIADKIIGAIGVFRDITREKEIDKAKSEFISLASHQLKTPPTAIKLLTERLLGGKMGTLTEKQKEYFSDIRSSNQRMIDMVNALLNVSRIELGAFTIEVSEKDVCSIVQNILFELKSIIDQKQLKLKIISPEKNVALMLDESLFRMVINNLVTNAINYTAEGGQVQVECRTVDKGQELGGGFLAESCFVVVVSDTGYGIPQVEQSKMFNKFFRADNIREKHTDGTGLGLYIVKSILDHSGGFIWFTSVENKGSVFYVAIPMTGMRVKIGKKELVDNLILLKVL